MKNNNRIYGNHIIVGTKDGQAKYFNWHQDDMIDSKENATGYHSKRNAQDVIDQIKTQFPGHTWKTELDK